MAAFNLSLPAGYAIDGLHFLNSTANAITGGIKIGTSFGATDVDATIAIGANADIWVPGTTLSKLFLQQLRPAVALLRCGDCLEQREADREGDRQVHRSDYLT